MIDIFAGPGGLSEGFSSILDDKGVPAFEISLSVEKDIYAYETLRLRTFYREFIKIVPEEYYEFLRGNLNLRDLYNRYPLEAAESESKTWRASLGPKGVSLSEVRSKVSGALDLRSEFVLIGGPPCQAYSLAGRSRNAGNPNYNPDNDERQNLYIEYLQFLADFKPAVFVMENVKGILSAKVREQNIFRKIVSDLRRPKEALAKEGREALGQNSCEYMIFSLNDGRIIADGNPRNSIIKAEDYGIPQTRHRVFLLGIREDLGKVNPAHLIKQEPVPIEKVINDLPVIRSGISEGYDSSALWVENLRSQLDSSWVNFDDKGDEDKEFKIFIQKILRAVVSPSADRGKEFLSSKFFPSYNKNWYFDLRLGGVCNHTSRNHIRKDLYRYFFAACYAKFYGVSPKLKDFPTVLLPNHSNAEKAVRSNSNFSDRFRVQISNLPSRTVVSHISKDGHYYIHPDPLQCRSLTVREAARIQTFPDNYYFCGPRTSQYIQVGNAVPPLLSKQIAEIVLDVLVQAERLKNKDKKECIKIG